MAGRPISSEIGAVLQKLTKTVSAALLALRPTFQRRFQLILSKARIHIEKAFSGPLVTLDGEHGLIRRVRAINRWLENNYHDHDGLEMETFDLSECYSKLDQDELLKDNIPDDNQRLHRQTPPSSDTNRKDRAMAKLRIGKTTYRKTLPH